MTSLPKRRPMAAKYAGKKATQKARAVSAASKVAAARARKANQNNKTIETEKKTMNATSNKQFEKFTQDAASMGQEQVEALVKSGTILAKGMEDILKTCMTIAQSTTEKSQEAAKTMMACKTLNEFTEAQSKLAQDSFEDFMATATKLSELSIKVATDSLEPINDQVGKAMKKAAA